MNVNMRALCGLALCAPIAFGKQANRIHDLADQGSDLGIMDQQFKLFKDENAKLFEEFKHNNSTAIEEVQPESDLNKKNITEADSGIPFAEPTPSSEPAPAVAVGPDVKYPEKAPAEPEHGSDDDSVYGLIGQIIKIVELPKKGERYNNTMAKVTKYDDMLEKYHVTFMFEGAPKTIIIPLENMTAPTYAEYENWEELPGEEQKTETKTATPAAPAASTPIPFVSSAERNGENKAFGVEDLMAMGMDLMEDEAVQNLINNENLKLKIEKLAEDVSSNWISGLGYMNDPDITPAIQTIVPLVKGMFAKLGGGKGIKKVVTDFLKSGDGNPVDNIMDLVGPIVGEEGETQLRGMLNMAMPFIGPILDGEGGGNPLASIMQMVGPMLAAQGGEGNPLASIMSMVGPMLANGDGNPMGAIMSMVGPMLANGGGDGNPLGAIMNMVGAMGGNKQGGNPLGAMAGMMNMMGAMGGNSNGDSNPLSQLGNLASMMSAMNGGN